MLKLCIIPPAGGLVLQARCMCVGLGVVYADSFPWVPPKKLFTREVSLPGETNSVVAESEMDATGIGTKLAYKNHQPS